MHPSAPVQHSGPQYSYQASRGRSNLHLSKERIFQTQSLFAFVLCVGTFVRGRLGWRQSLRLLWIGLNGFNDSHWAEAVFILSTLSEIGMYYECARALRGMRRMKADTNRGCRICESAPPLRPSPYQLALRRGRNASIAPRQLWIQTLLVFSIICGFYTATKMWLRVEEIALTVTAPAPQ